MKKYVVILAAVMMHLCLGGIYAWSAFIQPLRSEYGFTNAQTQYIPGVCALVFTAWTVVAGRLQDRFGPRPLAIASGLLLGAGYLVAGWSGGSYPLVLLGAGVLNGLAVGTGYVCPIAAAVKWFPQHKGLVSGLALAGYGASAIVLSSAAGALLARGWNVLAIFRAVGLVYAVVVVAAGALLSVPPRPAGAPTAPLRYRSLLTDRRFWLLCVGMFCGSLPGYAFASNLKPIGLKFGLAAATAMAGIAAFTVGNATGRIAWGGICDRLGGRRTIPLSLGLIAASVAGVIAAGGSAHGFLPAAAFVGFCYGGCFSIYASQVAHTYGSAALGTVYPLVLVAHGLCGLLGTAMVGKARDLTGSFAPGLWGALAFAAAGLVALLVLRPSPARDGAGA